MKLVCSGNKISVLSFIILCSCASIIFTGCQTTKLNNEAVKLAAELPIADVHMHAYSWVSPAEAKDRMDKNGVRWAGFGHITKKDKNGRKVMEDYRRELGDRFIAWGGQSELNSIYFKYGIEAVEDVNNPLIQSMLREGEEDLREGRIKGFGEIFVNNSTTSKHPSFRRKFRADAPSIRALFGLVARYNSFLAFHMEPDKNSIAQLEHLLSSDLKGRIIWNHAGCYTQANTVRKLLSRHPNLYCDLSFRYPPVANSKVVSKNPNYQIFGGYGAPDPDWLKLIEEFPDRFMIGTDTYSRYRYDLSIKEVREKLLPYLSITTSRKVAYENAQRLFGLK